MRHLSRIFPIIATLMLIIPQVACSTAPVDSQRNASTGMRLVAEAKTLVGTPYQYGGDSPKGFDCSGFVQFTHHKVGINIPRTTQSQLKQSRPIKLAWLQPGDLIFFHLSGHKTSHVGIYIGHNQMIHAPSSGKRVAYASIGIGSYWRSHIIAGGRFY